MQEISLPILNFESGLSSGATGLSSKVFGTSFKKSLIHQVIVAYLAGARAGTRAQKSRSEARGGGRKPWRQKGTGQARAGTIRSPLWRGGGVTFAAKPQNYSQKVNKKAYRVAIRSILSELFRQNRLLLVENLSLESLKTREFYKKLKKLGVANGLIITDSIDKNLYFASRNLFKITVSDVFGINPVDLIKFEKILLTLPALMKIEEMLA